MLHKQNNVRLKNILDFLNIKNDMFMCMHTDSFTKTMLKQNYKNNKNYQSDMLDNMSIIVLTHIHKSFVHFFGIGSVSSYYL